MSLPSDVLRYIARHIGPEATTLETGCGVSTLVFLIKGANHTCVSPDAHAVDRIRDYCRANDVALDRARFEVEPSEVVLPRLELKDVDLVLIDGSHSFPAVFIDWYYTAPSLKIGGLMVIDDVDVWTGKVLKDFLGQEDEWSIDASFGNRSVAFRKVSEIDPFKGWWLQRYVVERSGKEPISTKSIARALGKVRRGEFGEIAKSIRRRLGD